MMIKVLFVCSGNICRSPMAEVIFTNLAKKHKRKDILVASAGTDADFGVPMSPYSRKALIACGEKLPHKEHRSRRLTQEMLDEFNPRVVDVRYIDDPWGHDLDRYIAVCKQLQRELQLMYNDLTK